MKKLRCSIIFMLIVASLTGCTSTSGDIEFVNSKETSSIVWELSSSAAAYHHDIFDDQYYYEEEDASDENSVTDEKPDGYSIFDEPYLDESSMYEETSSTEYTSSQNSSKKENSSKRESSENSSSKKANSEKSISNQSSFDPSAKTMRERLTGSDAEIYDELCTAFSNYEFKIVLDGDVKSDKLDYIYRCISDDHPEFFWVPYGYRGGYYMDYIAGKTLVQFDALMGMTKENIPQYKKKFESSVDKVLSLVPKDGTLYDKILFIHDYLVKNCDYQDGSENCYSAYGCLVEQKAVCSGYTPAFQLLLHRLGVECGNVVGFATSSGEAHTWNYVKCEGEYYWVDVTWDDPVSETSDYQGNADISHSYFFITSEQLERTHAISVKESPFIPNCTATDYCYMKVTGNYMDEYSFEKFDKLTTEKKGSVSVQLGSRSAFVEAVQDLFYNHKIYDTEYFSEHDYTNIMYLLDEEMYIIEIYAD